MEDLIAALALFIALTLYFSFFGFCPVETAMPNGFGTQRKGDSGLVIPGDGKLPADTFIESESIPERSERTEKVTEVTTEVTSEETTQENKEEHNKVDNMFWHGVAAVLIGQLSVPLVTFLLKKIRGGKDG